MGFLATFMLSFVSLESIFYCGKKINLNLVFLSTFKLVGNIPIHRSIKEPTNGNSKGVLHKLL